jgi:hypothetical protein
MCIPMRNVAFVAACSLLSLAACGDGVTPPPPSAEATSLPPRSGTIGVAAREIPLGGRVTLQGPLVTSPYLDEVPGPYAWSTRDPSVAVANPGSGLVSWILGVKPGITELYVDANGVRATVPITVLDTLQSAPSPVVVEDFYVIEFGGEGGNWGYAPQLVLRDTVGRLEAAVIAISIELPEAGRSPRCAMLRTVTGAGDPLFREYYGDFELWINGPGGYRAPRDQPVIAHLTLRVPGPYAKELTIKGRVVPGDWPTTYSAGATGDVLSCG